MAARRPGVFLPALLVTLAFVVLLGLGFWQLERKEWKEALIATVTERLTVPPGALPPRERWGALRQSEQEYRRVSFPAEYLYDQEALVYAAGSAFRPDVSGPGYWVFTPARLAGGSIVVVNRGFVPEGRQAASLRNAGRMTGLVEIVGVLRWPEPRPPFAPDDDPGRNLWFSRDINRIALDKNWGAVSPFYVEQESPVFPDGLPKAGPLKVRLRNDHFGYALTWFGLAGSLLVIFFLWLGRRRSAD